MKPQPEMKRQKKRNPVDFLSGCLGNKGLVAIQRFIG
jgi:hypothetical protein